jgi:hypothetical protein
MDYCEVYDDGAIQFSIRKQAARLYSIITALVAVTAIAVALVVSGLVPFAPALVTVAIAWIAVVTAATARQKRLRQVAWCVKLTAESITGFDYERRRRSMDWNEVDRVDIRDDGLHVVNCQGDALCIPASFPEFHLLSHRIVRIAEEHAARLCINEKPWQEIDVYAIYPFLMEQATEGHGLR